MKNPVKIISSEIRSNSICIPLLEELLRLDKIEWQYRLNNQFVLLGNFSDQFGFSIEEVEKCIAHLELCGYLEKVDEKRNRLVITPDGKEYLKEHHRSKSITGKIKKAASFARDLEALKVIVYSFAVVFFLLVFHGLSWLIDRL